MVPRDLNVTDGRERVTRDIRQFYLGSKQVGIESVDEMIAVRITTFPLNTSQLKCKLFTALDGSDVPAGHTQDSAQSRQIWRCAYLYVSFLVRWRAGALQAHVGPYASRCVSRR